MKNRNVVLRIAGLFLVVGVALYFVGMAAFASDKKSAGTVASEIIYEEKTYTASAEDIGNILLKIRNMPVTVKPTKGSEVTLRYYTCEQDPYDVTLENGVLTLKYRNQNLFYQGSWFSGWNVFNIVSQSNPSVELTVPESYAGSFQIGTSNATVSLFGFAKAKDVRVETSNASVQVTDMTAGTVSVHSSNGGLTLERVIASGRLDAQTSNASITARQAAAQDTLFLQTSNGRITVDQVTSKSIELRSSNASVSGSVGGKRGEYNVSSSTSNGDNNLGSGGSGPYRLTVNTSNGSINIHFLGE